MAEKIKVVAGSTHLFGSGAGSALLLIDGDVVTPTINGPDNGFVRWNLAEVEVFRLRNAKLVMWHQGAIPGSHLSYTGSGKGFLRYLTKTKGVDPLTLRWRDRPANMSRKRAALARCLARRLEAQGFQTVVDEHAVFVYYRAKTTVRLPDGCLGKKWSQWGYEVV